MAPEDEHDFRALVVLAIVASVLIVLALFVLPTR